MPPCRHAANAANAANVTNVTNATLPPRSRLCWVLPFVIKWRYAMRTDK